MLRRVTAVCTIYRAPVGVDENGYPLNTTSPEDWEQEEWPVYSIQPREITETFSRGEKSVHGGLRVSAPLKGPRPGPDDRIKVPGFDEGGLFDTDGETAVWDTNPILSRTLYGGIVVNLERTRR